MPTPNGPVSIRDVYDQIEKLEDKIDRNYVHKNDFEPVKRVVYGLVGLVLIAVAKLILDGNINVTAW